MFIVQFKHSNDSVKSKEIRVFAGKTYAKEKRSDKLEQWTECIIIKHEPEEDDLFDGEYKYIEKRQKRR